MALGGLILQTIAGHTLLCRTAIQIRILTGIQIFYIIPRPIFQLHLFQLKFK
jgi:hypothetical protein